MIARQRSLTTALVVVLIGILASACVTLRSNDELEKLLRERLGSELCVGDPASRIEEVLTELGFNFICDEFRVRYSGGLRGSRQVDWKGMRSVVLVYVSEDQSFESFTVRTSYTFL